MNQEHKFKKCIVQAKGDAEDLLVRNLKFIHTARWEEIARLGKFPHDFFSRCKSLKNIYRVYFHNATHKNLENYHMIVRTLHKYIKQARYFEKTFEKQYEKFKR